jgi:hypothetical protein
VAATAVKSGRASSSRRLLGDALGGGPGGRGGDVEAADADADGERLLRPDPDSREKKPRLDFDDATSTARCAVSDDDAQVLLLVALPPLPRPHRA